MHIQSARDRGERVALGPTRSPQIQSFDAARGALSGLTSSPARRGWDPVLGVLSALSAAAGSPARDPVVVADRIALSLCLAQRRLLLPLARAAECFLREKAWFSFGYARLEDHARERFRRSGRWVRDLGVLAA